MHLRRPQVPAAGGVVHPEHFHAPFRHFCQPLDLHHLVDLHRHRHVVLVRAFLPEIAGPEGLEHDHGEADELFVVDHAVVAVDVRDEHGNVLVRQPARQVAELVVKLSVVLWG
jgi:hypothetical protein